MIVQPKQIRCIQIRQNESGLSLPYTSFFITNIESVKCKINKYCGGDFELTLPYTKRNVDIFGSIEYIPTFILMNFMLDEPWDTQTAAKIPHAMPMMAETYYEEHNLEESEHTIKISGRSAFEVMLSNKVVCPKLVYQSPDNTPDDERGFYPWDIMVDLFGRNVNGEKTPSVLTPRTSTPTSYLSPPDPRFVSDVSLLHDITPRSTDPLIERSFEGDSLLDVITNLTTANNLYISGYIKEDAGGKIHLDFMIRRLEDLSLGSSKPLVYDYNAMPPKSYNALLSIQELRQTIYVKVPPMDGQEDGDVYTVTRGSKTDNAKYKGWGSKELYLDSSSLPFGDVVNDKYVKMLSYAAADELYKDGNMLIKLEDAEYLYTPMKFFKNCWPGCIYTSIGPSGNAYKLVITAFVLTGSKRDGWVVTPELSHYTDPYE